MQTLKEFFDLLTWPEITFLIISGLLLFGLSIQLASTGADIARNLQNLTSFKQIQKTPLKVKDLAAIRLKSLRAIRSVLLICFWGIFILIWLLIFSLYGL